MLDVPSVGPGFVARVVAAGSRRVRRLGRQDDAVVIRNPNVRAMRLLELSGFARIPTVDVAPGRASRDGR